jgi:hypothetical protein
MHVVVGGGDGGAEREERQRSRAQGMERERYALPDAERALAQRASQRSDVTMRTLPGALLSAPRPDRGTPGGSPPGPADRSPP